MVAGWAALLRCVVLAFGVLAGHALPALANCSERSIDLAAVDAAQARAIARRMAGPEGAYIAGYRDGIVTTTPAFDDLPPKRRAALLSDAAFAYREALTPAEAQDERDQGFLGSPISVHDALGRPTYIYTACFGDFLLLTEHQRYLTGFSIWSVNQRVERHALPPRVKMKSVKASFHRVMSWKPAYFIAWVPEGGYFEIDLARPGELTKLRAFWPHAPRGFRYDVLLNDGRRIARVQR